MRQKFLAVLISVFLIFWCVGLVAGFTAGGCRQPRMDAAKKVNYCTVSITLGSILPGESGKRSILFLERAIALSKLQRHAEAASDMQRAIHDATDGRPRLMLWAMRQSVWMERLNERAAKEPGTVVEFWQQQLRAMK